jgi:hypothetical protein
MSIATYQKLTNEINAPNDRIGVLKSLGSTAQPTSTWLVASQPVAGAAPTTAVVPTNATVGSLGQQNGGTPVLRMVGWDLNVTGGHLWVCDRLSHQGGLDATVTTAQTTNLPTAALTRYTSGVGVMAALEIYTQIGITGTTVAASYTNSAGVAGRTSPLIGFGNTNFREQTRLFILPLQQGDVGVKSVESVTVTATTGTAGNFGVTLLRPLVPLSVLTVLSPYMSMQNAMIHLGGFLPEVLDNACLWFVDFAGAANNIIQGDIRFAEDT